jgi:hypothetical protein
MVSRLPCQIVEKGERVYLLITKHIMDRVQKHPAYHNNREAKQEGH